MADGKGNATAVAFRTPLDAELCVALIARLLKFLLYMRGQVPCVFDELDRVVVDYREQQQQIQASNRKLATGAMRKALKCVESVESALQEGLPAVFAGRVQTVAIVFGASLLSPREAVMMDFSGVARADLMDVDTVENGSYAASSPITTKLPAKSLPKEKLGRLCAQKLLRALIVDGAHQRTCDIAVTRVHIAVLAEKQHARAIPGFQPKQNFSLRLPKSRRHQNDRTHWIQVSAVGTSGGAGGASGSSTSSTGTTCATTELSGLFSPTAPSDDDSLIWYVLEKPIHGFVGTL